MNEKEAVTSDSVRLRYLTQVLKMGL